MYIFYMYIHTQRYPPMIILCHTCYFSAWSCQMLCMCTQSSIHILQIPWTVLSLQCFTQAEKTSFSVCVAESEFLPVRRRYLWCFCSREESGVFPSSFLPSVLSKLGASAEHAAAEAMGGMDLRAGGVLLFLGAKPGSWLRSAHCKEGSANTSHHINVNIFGWLQMRLQGVSGCFGNQLLELLGSVAGRREVWTGVDHLPYKHRGCASSCVGTGELGEGRKGSEEVGRRISQVAGTDAVQFGGFG